MLIVILLTWKLFESSRTKLWPFSLELVTDTMSLIIKENVACAGQVSRRAYSSHNDESRWQVNHTHSPALSPMLPSRKWLSGVIAQVTVNSHTFNIPSNLVLWPAFSHIGKNSLFMSWKSNSCNLVIWDLFIPANQWILNKKNVLRPKEDTNTNVIFSELSIKSLDE